MRRQPTRRTRACGGFSIVELLVAVCSSFVDGSARKVPLPELWELRWSKGFTPTEIQLPQP